MHREIKMPKKQCKECEYFEYYENGILDGYCFKNSPTENALAIPCDSTRLACKEFLKFEKLENPKELS